MSADEPILGVPRTLVIPTTGWTGVLYGEVGPLVERLERAATVRRRGDAEDDPAWKQLIPYLVVRDRGQIGRAHV